MKLFTRSAFCALSLILSITACTTEKQALQPDKVRRTIANDMKTVFPEEGKGDVLTLEMAVARAIKFNLDKIVAETEAFVAKKDVTLQGLEGLPSVTARFNRIGRDNPGGSSSRSLQTGIQSLEPSISTDQYRNTQKIEANWNILNAGIAIGRARGASDRQKAALERRRKVFEDIVSAVYGAYWRTAAAQRELPVIESLIARSDTEIKKLDAATKAGLIPFGEGKSLKGTMLDKRSQLIAQKEKLMYSEITLKALTAIPPSRPITLDITDKNWLSGENLPRVTRGLDDMQSIALLNRPEVREQFLNKAIAQRNVQLELIQTFPGADVVMGLNRDENSFLANPTWFDWTLGLTASITKILTLPARYQKAKADSDLTDKRRQALIAAVITQVTISYARFHQQRGFFDAVSDVDENARQIARRATGFAKAGMMGPPQQVSAEIDSEIAHVNRLVTFGDAQEAYAQLLGTLGIDLWDGDTRGMPLPEISAGVRRGLQALEDQVMAPETNVAKG